MSDNFLSSLIRGVARTFRRPTEKKIIEIPSRYDDTLVLYNEANVDSMLATAVVFFTQQFGNVRAKSWHHLDHRLDLTGVKTLVCMGHELEKDLVHTFIVGSDVHLVLPMREGAYDWLEEEQLYKAHKERFTLIKADYEDVSPLHRLTDNTFTRLMQYLVHERKFDTKLPMELNDAVPYVLRYTTFAYPIAEFNVGLNESYPAETENNFRILLRELTLLLTQALGQSNQKEALQSVHIEDMNERVMLTYSQWHQRVTSQIGRSISNATIVVQSSVKDIVKGIGREELSNKSWNLRVVALTEHDIHQLGLVPFNKAHAIVAYEDIRGLRFYRIYAKDINTGRSIAEAMKADHIYVEGVFVTAVTEVPNVFMR